MSFLMPSRPPSPANYVIQKLTECPRNGAVSVSVWPNFLVEGASEIGKNQDS
jgi:hypothetical protein